MTDSFITDLDLWQHQGAVITSNAELDESLQLMLFSQHMVTKVLLIVPLVH